MLVLLSFLQSMFEARSSLTRINAEMMKERMEKIHIQLCISLLAGLLQLH